MNAKYLSFRHFWLSQNFALYSIPMFFDILFLSSCTFQVRFSSIRTHKFCIEFTLLCYVVVVLLIFNCGSFNVVTNFKFMKKCIFRLST